MLLNRHWYHSICTLQIFLAINRCVSIVSLSLLLTNCCYRSKYYKQRHALLQCGKCGQIDAKNAQTFFEEKKTCSSEGYNIHYREKKSTWKSIVLGQIFMKCWWERERVRVRGCGDHAIFQSECDLWKGTSDVCWRLLCICKTNSSWNSSEASKAVSDMLHNTLCIWLLQLPSRPCHLLQLHFLLVFIHTLCENASRSVYVFHIHFGWFIFEWSVCVCVCVPFECDACVRACLRFIRLLTIRNITNGAKVTAFVHHCIATIFASLYASACVRISGCSFSISFTRTRFLSSFGSPLVRQTHTHYQQSS